MKKNQKPWLALPLLLCLLAGCGKQDAGPEQQVREYYNGLEHFSTTATVTADSGVIMEYQLAIEKTPEQSSATVVEPQEIAGVRCVISENGTKLQYDDAELETLLPAISGFTPVDCVDGLLNSLAGGVPTEWGKEEKEGISCLALTYELDAEGRAAAKRVWLQEDTLEPVCAEWFLEGDRILHAVFHNGEKDGQTEGAGA